MKLSFDPTKWFSERPLLICFAFGALSVLATLHNKFIFSNHIVGSSNMLLLIQNLVTIAALWGLRKLKILDFEATMSSRGDWLCGIAYALSVVCGLWSLFFVNVVMYGALKRCTTIVTWVIEWKFTPSDTTMKCLPALILMTVGTLQASFYDFQFSAPGYILAFLSCVTQGGAYELGRRVARRNKGVCAVLYSNSIVAILILTVLVIFTGDLWEALAGGGVGGYHKHQRSLQLSVDTSAASAAPTTLAAAAASSASSLANAKHYNFIATTFHLCANAMTCLFMNYFVFLNCFVNSPLAHSVTGNMKVVMTTVIGGIMFGFALDVAGAVGLLMNMASGFWFSAVKLNAKMAAKAKEKKEAAGAQSLSSMESGAASMGTGSANNGSALPPAGSSTPASRGASSGQLPLRPHHLLPSFGAALDAPPRVVSTFGSPTALSKKRLGDSGVNLSTAETSSPPSLHEGAMPNSFTATIGPSAATIAAPLNGLTAR